MISYEVRVLVFLLSILQNGDLLRVQDIPRQCFKLEGDTKTFAFKKNVSNPLLAKKIVLEVNMFVSDLASGKRNFPTRYYYLEHTTDTCTQTMEVNIDPSMSGSININTNVYVRDRSDYFSDSSSAIMSVPNEGIIDVGDMNGLNSLLIRVRSSSGQILPDGNARDLHSFDQYLMEDTTPQKVLIMSRRTKKIHIEYEAKEYNQARETSSYGFFTAASVQMFSETDGRLQSTYPLSQYDFGGYTLPRSDHKVPKVPKFHIVVADSTKTYRLVVQVKNIATGYMERSIYRITGTTCKWVKAKSDFEIKNIDSELYDRSKTYSDEESKILMFGLSAKPKRCVFQSLIGTLWQTTFNGRVVDQHAWAPIYLNQTRSAYVIRRLSVAEREICKAHIFT